MLAQLDQALAEADALLADPASSDEDMLEAWKTLSQIIHMLDFTSDKSALQAAVTLYEGIDRSKYVSDEWLAAFEEALAHAKDVLADENALDETSILPALHALEEAFAMLTPKADVLDTSLLEMLVAAVEDTDLSRYLSEGTDLFTRALQQAKTVLDNPQSQEDIDLAMEDLHQAWLALRLKADESLLEELKSTLVLLRKPALMKAMNPVQMARRAALDEKMETLLSQPEADQATVQALLEEAKALIAETENGQSRPEAPTVSQKPTAEKPAADSTRPADGQSASSVKASVSTAAQAAAGLWAAAAGAAAALWMALKKRNKNR